MLSSRPAPEIASREGTTLGFESLTSLLSFGALLLLLTFAPLQLSGFWAGDYNFWPQAMLLLLGAAVSLLLALSPDTRPQFSPTAWALLGFLLWSTVAIATSVYKHDSYLEVARVFGAVMAFFAVVSLWSRERAIWIVGAWILGVLIGDRIALWDFLTIRAIAGFGSFSNPNMLATALAMTLPIALILPILARRKKAGFGVALAFVPFLLCCIGLLGTASKGGFLAALIALCVTGVLIIRAKASTVGTLVKRNKAVFIGGSVVALLLFGAVAMKTVVPRLREARGAQDNSTMFRAYVWRAAWDMVKAKPVSGFGPGSFPHVVSKFSEVEYTRHAHQSLTQVAAESGLPATLLLLGAILTAIGAGWKKLRSEDWPLAAGAIGAVIAFLVHTGVDSGFQTTSIAILLAVALAILVADSSPRPASNARLNPFWLGATLLLALAGNQTQKAAAGEDLRADGEYLARQGAASTGIGKVKQATEADPGAARVWLTLGRLQESAGDDSEAALKTAADLQPTVAANWSNLARRAERKGEPIQADEYYAKALETSPRDTRLLLERAEFLLGTKDSKGYADLEKIIALWNAPYGRYSPIEQNVNLDFARATMLLSKKMSQEGKKTELKELVKHALADCKRAQKFEAQNRAQVEQMMKETGMSVGYNVNEDLDALVSNLEQLQTAIQ